MRRLVTALAIPVLAGPAAGASLRLSNTLRYASPFPRPDAPFTPDVDTAALYHFDEGSGNVVGDASAGGSDGERFFGGAGTPGPEWSSSSPFADEVPGLGASATATRVLAALLAACGVLHFAPSRRRRT